MPSTVLGLTVAIVVPRMRAHAGFPARNVVAHPVPRVFALAPALRGEGRERSERVRGCPKKKNPAAQRCATGFADVARSSRHTPCAVAAQNSRRHTECACYFQNSIL